MAEELLCVGGPLAGSMAQHPGCVLTAIEPRPGMISFRQAEHEYRYVHYHPVRFRCGDTDVKLWTCLSDLDTFLELCNHYKNPRDERPPRRASRYTCGLDLATVRDPTRQTPTQGQETPRQVPNQTRHDGGGSTTQGNPASGQECRADE